MTEIRITSRKNPLLQQVKKLLSSKKEREAAGLFVADGTKLLQEAIQYWPGLETVILSDGVEAAVPESVQVVRIPEDVMQSISPMQSPQGALFLCRLPEKTANPECCFWMAFRTPAIWERSFVRQMRWMCLWCCWKAAQTLLATR